MDTALEHTDTDCQNPELPFVTHNYCDKTDSGVTANTGHEQFFARIFGGEFAEDNRARECDDLRDEQRDDKLDRAEVFKAEVAAHAHCHFNNRMHAVDIEEERNQEEQRFFVLGKFF